MKTPLRTLVFASAVLAWGTAAAPALAAPLGHFANAGEAGSTGSGGNRDGGHNEGHTEGKNSGLPGLASPQAGGKDSGTTRSSELDAGGLGHSH